MGLITIEAKTAVLLNLPYSETLNKLEHFIGLTNWNRHLVPRIWMRNCHRMNRFYAANLDFADLPRYTEIWVSLYSAVGRR